MGRLLGIPFVLVAIPLAAYLFVQHNKAAVPSPAAAQAVTQADAAVAATNFASAHQVLQAWFAQHATYAGATLPPGIGVVLARAGASGYCLQTEDGTQHLLGPGGQPEPGLC
jgi:hypothetical protein